MTAITMEATSLHFHTVIKQFTLAAHLTSFTTTLGIAVIMAVTTEHLDHLATKENLAV